MLTYPLDFASKKPLYEQLYLFIRHDIMSGVLPGGARLPSKRTLAAHLEISVMTVESAYAQLLAEGYILSRPRSGYFVQTFSDALTPAPARPAPPRPTPPAPDTPAQPPILYDFRSDRVDTGRFPFATWARLSRAVLTDYADHLLSPIPSQGVPELQAAICAHLRAFRGIDVPPDRILVGAGSEFLLLLLLQLLGREAAFALEEPGYRQLSRLLTANGVPLCAVGMDGDGLRPDLLSQTAANVVYLTPSHQFPTGVILSASRRLTLLRWAAAQDDRWIIEDDADAEFRFASRPAPTLYSLARNDQVIYLNTFTRSLAPSFRIAYLVLPERLLNRYRTQLSFYSSTVPALEQYTLARFLSSGAFERHLNRSRSTYKGRLDRLLSALRASPLWGRISVSGENAGLHILLTLKGALSEAEMISRARAKGVRVYGLSDHYSDPSGCPPSTVLLGYAAMEGEAIEKGVERLGEAWG